MAPTLTSAGYAETMEAIHSGFLPAKTLDDMFVTVSSAYGNSLHRPSEWPAPPPLKHPSSNNKLIASPSDLTQQLTFLAGYAIAKCSQCHQSTMGPLHLIKPTNESAFHRSHLQDQLNSRCTCSRRLIPLVCITIEIKRQFQVHLCPRLSSSREWDTTAALYIQNHCVLLRLTRNHWLGFVKYTITKFKNVLIDHSSVLSFLRTNSCHGAILTSNIVCNAKHKCSSLQRKRKKILLQ